MIARIRLVGALSFCMGIWILLAPSEQRLTQIEFVIGGIAMMIGMLLMLRPSAGYDTGLLPGRTCPPVRLFPRSSAGLRSKAL